MGQFLVEQIINTVGQAKSPVEGESWPKLSKEYLAKKKAELGSSKADMELTGDMLDSLTFKTTSDGVEIGFFGSEAAKADGHNKLSGRENNAPQRRFLPDKGDSFKSDITREVENIIVDQISESQEFPAAELEEIRSKTELYDYLEKKLGLQSRTEIKFAVFRNQDLVSRLSDFDLLDLI